MPGKTARLLVIPLLCGFAALSNPTVASAAAPDCVVDHDVESVADHWTLEIVARCNEISAVKGMTWFFMFWAEPQGGGERPGRYFTAGGQPINESRRVNERSITIKVDAPRGYARYCYNARGTFISNTPQGRAPMREYTTGTICKDAL